MFFPDGVTFTGFKEIFSIQMIENFIFYKIHKNTHFLNVVYQNVFTK